MPTFPTIASPPVVWFDGNQPAWQDSGATVPAVAITDRVQRIGEPSPLTGVWSAPSAAARPFRDTAGVRLEPLGTAGGYSLLRADPGGVYWDSCTIVVAFVARDNSYAGPTMGLIDDGTERLGIRIGSDHVAPNTAAGLWDSGLALAPGKLNVIAVTYTPTGVAVKLDANGVVNTATFATSIPHTLATDWRISSEGTAEYGSFMQAIVTAAPLSSTDRDAVMAWAKAQSAPPAYPDDRVLLTWVGDSITRSTATSYNNCFAFRCLQSVRDAGYPAENCNVGAGGAGVARLLDPTVIGAPSTQNMFFRGSAFYSPARVANVMIIALGTNDLANSNPPQFVLHGTGVPNDTGSYPGSGIYPLVDAAVAQGWRVVVVGITPRSDNPSWITTYESWRNQVADDLVANCAAHGAVYVDVRGLVNYGRLGDSDNTTYYADKIHPVDAGQALVAPAITAGILAALAAPVVTGKPLSIERVLDWEADPSIYLFSLKNSA